MSETTPASDPAAAIVAKDATPSAAASAAAATAPPAGQPPTAGGAGYSGAPPPGAPYHPGYYPPPGQYYAPPPPPGQYPYQAYPGYYPPPGQYPPPPGQYPPPPAGAYSPPAGAPPGAPPAAPYGYPPPGGAPPAGYSPYGAPYAMPTSPAVPGAPPPAAVPYHHAPPAQRTDPLWYLETQIPDPQAPPAAHGAQKVPGFDPEVKYKAIQKAFDSATSNDLQIQVMKILRPLTVFEMDALNDFCVAKEGTSLADKIDQKISGDYGKALRGLTLGPLGYDVDLARKALAGVGTDEFLLVELILGRPGHEIRWLKTGYRLKYGKDLTEAIKSDLSGSVERMFVMALNTQKPENEPYVDYARVDADVDSLNAASKKKEETPFFEIFINRSNAHLGAVIEKYGSKYKSLSKIIKKTFSGIIEKALLYVLHGVKPKRDRQGIWRDAKLLEATMAGLGTRDTQLIYRIVRAHWNPARLDAIKTAYKNRYGKTLESRVKGETSGPYKDLLIDIITKTEVAKK